MLGSFLKVAAGKYGSLQRNFSGLNMYSPKDGCQVHCAHEDNLGEGPMWHPDYQKFFWIDIHGQKLSSFDLKTKARKNYALEKESLTALAPKKGGFVGTFSTGGFASIDLKTDLKTTILSNTTRENSPKSDLLKEEERFNDGKCDPRGRFLAGTMDQTFLTGGQRGNLFHFDKQNLGSPKLLLENISISNGPSWSLDGKTFYFTDSWNKSGIWKFDYNLDNGEITNQSVFMQKPENLPGVFDGSTVDSDGFLWWAIFGGGCVLRIDGKSGKIERTIDQKGLGIDNPTSVAFGGKDYRTMFITSESWQPGQTFEKKESGSHGGFVTVEFDFGEGIQGVEPSFWQG